MSRLAQTMAKSDARRRRRPAPAPVFILDEPEAGRAAPLLSDDVRLFLMTFIGGFLFVSVYLA